MRFVPKLAFLLGASATVLFLADDASAQKVHVVIVALTDDFNLGDLCEKDVSDVKGVFSGRVPYDQLNFVTFSGDRANRAAVINEVNALAVGRDDAVLFYYSGHGFIDQNNRNYMYLQDQSKLYVYEIQNLVGGKSPRLSALLFDMCSAPDTPRRQAPDDRMLMAAPPGAPPKIVIPPLIDALFFKARGTALIIGSSPGELGQSDPNRIRGGLFTYCFTDTIRKNLQTPFGWEPIFNSVRGKVQQEFQRNWPGGMDLARATGGQLRGIQATQTPVAYELPGQGNGGPVNPGGGGSTPPPPPARGPVFGATVLNYNGPGVFVSQVVPNGPAAQAGLEPRDVILEINGRRISSEAEFGQAIDASGRDMDITVQNWRDRSIVRGRVRLNK